MRHQARGWQLVGGVFAGFLATAWASLGSPVELRSTNPQSQSSVPKWNGRGAVVVLIPGTYSECTGADWASPGNATYETLRRKTDAAIKTFTWSGKDYPWNREAAALSLLEWARQEGIGPTRPLYVVAHSHGGNVALLAAKHGLHIEGLTLLCTPVYPGYLPLTRSRLGTAQLDNIGFVHQVYAEGDPVQRNAKTLFPGNVDVTCSGESGTRLPDVTNGDNIDYERLEQQVSGHQPAILEPGRGGIEKHTDCHSPEVLSLLIATNSLKGMPFVIDGARKDAATPPATVTNVVRTDKK